MRIRVLGCSGAIARGCHTTAFLVDDDLLVDAGTGVGQLTLREMRRIDHVLLTHAHLDHVAALPLMLDAVGAPRAAPLRVHAPAGAIAALRAHVFNGHIWPDFTRLPTPQAPFLQLHPLAAGQALSIGGRRIEALPATHTVDSVGYALSAGGGCWAYTGDTGHNPALWRRLAQLELAALVIETTFGDQDDELARRSGHLSPRALERELRELAPGLRIPVYIMHAKPAQAKAILAQVRAWRADTGLARSGLDIRALRAGQVLQV